jgi:hypothetical protein
VNIGPTIKVHESALVIGVTSALEYHRFCVDKRDQLWLYLRQYLLNKSIYIYLYIVDVLLDHSLSGLLKLLLKCESSPARSEVIRVIN